MSFIDNYEKKQKGVVSSPVSEGMTVKEILTSKDSVNFGLLLNEEKADKSLIKRMADGNLDDGDFKELEKSRAKFAKKIEKAREIVQFLSKEDVNNLAKNNKGLQEIINLAGPENAVEAISEHLERISITDETTFNKLARNIDTLENFKKGQLKDVEDSVQKMMKEYKIKDEKALTDALLINDSYDREDALRKVVRDGMGWFRKTIDFVSGGDFSPDFGGVSTNDKIQNFGNKKQEIEDAITELNKQIKSVGGALAFTVNNNPEVRKAVSHDLIGKKVDKDAGKASFKDMMNIDNQSQEEMEKEMQIELDKRIKALGATWTANTLPEKQVEIDSVIDDYKNKIKKASPDIQVTGFWGTLFDMFSKKVDKKVEDAGNSLKSKLI